MSTCVGLRYGSTIHKFRDFSRKPGICCFVTVKSLPIASQINTRPDLPKHATYSLRPGKPTPSQHSLLRHPITVLPSTGILTRLPSITPLGLTLGADSPYADERCVGNLGLPASGNLTRFIVTHVSIRTSDTSSKLLSSPSTAYRTLRYRVHNKVHTCSFGG